MGEKKGHIRMRGKRERRAQTAVPLIARARHLPVPSKWAKSRCRFCFRTLDSVVARAVLVPRSGPSSSPPSSLSTSLMSASFSPYPIRSLSKTFQYID